MKDKLLNIIIIVFVLAICVISYMLFFRKIEVTGIVLDKKNINLIVGESTKLVATIYPSDASNKTITWQSSDEEIVIVDKDGIVKGIKQGEATISAISDNNDVTDTCNVKVSNKKVEKIELVKDIINLKVGELGQIEAKIVPNDATLKGLKYQSSDARIVTVDDNGKIEAKDNGIAEIIITNEEESVTAKCKVIVGILVEKIVLDKKELLLGLNEEEVLTATILPDNATNKEVIWESTDSTVLNVDSGGKITAKNVGEVEVVAKDFTGKVKDSCKVVVKRIEFEVTFDGSRKVYQRGELLGNLPTPTKKGMKFLGWYTSATGGEKVSVNTKVTSNLTLYAQWDAYYKHVFIIGVDGLGAALTKVSSPNFDRIFGNYAFRHDAKTEYATISAQNWGSILTGVAYNTHKYTNESIANNAKTSKSNNLSIFYYIRKAMPNAKLASIVNWNPINVGIIENDINVNMIHGSSDTIVTNEVVNYLKNNGAPTLMFVHFDEVDHAGHTYGGFSSNYYNAVINADKRIGQIFDTIKLIGALDESLFIVVTDHGETTNGHGGHTKEESSAVVAVYGNTVNKVTLDVNTQNRDVSAIVLYALGIDKPSHFVSKVPSNLFNK